MTFLLCFSKQVVNLFKVVMASFLHCDMYNRTSSSGSPIVLPSKTSLPLRVWQWIHLVPFLQKNALCQCQLARTVPCSRATALLCAPRPALKTSYLKKVFGAVLHCGPSQGPHWREWANISFFLFFFFKLTNMGSKCQQQQKTEKTTLQIL